CATFERSGGRVCWITPFAIIECTRGSQGKGFMQDAQRLQRVWELFDLTVDLAPEIRTGELAALEPDAGIRAEVEILLLAADTHTLDSTALPSPLPPLLPGGTRVGSWEIDSLLG